MIASHMQATRFALALGTLCKVRYGFQHASHLTDVQRGRCSTNEISAAVTHPSTKVVPFINEIETCGPSAGRTMQRSKTGRCEYASMDRRSLEQALRPRATPYDRPEAVGDVSPETQRADTVAQGQYEECSVQPLS